MKSWRGDISPARGLSLWISSYSLPSIVVSVFPESGTVLPLLATLLYLALSWSRLSPKRDFHDMKDVAVRLARGASRA